MPTIITNPVGPDPIVNGSRDLIVVPQTEAVLQAGALQKAIFNSANFSSIATDAKGVIQIFNVGAERMLGYAASEVTNKITLADISDPQEVIARAKTLSAELGTPITPGFEALVFKTEGPFLKATKPTTLPKKGASKRAVEQSNKDSHEKRNEHTVQILSHRAGQ